MSSTLTLPKQPSVDLYRPRSGRLGIGAEAIVLLCLLALGFVLRAWQLGAVSLDHYDEGVYAFSALGLSGTSHIDTLFPNQIRFSPPVYFGLVAFLYTLLGGPSVMAALSVNVLLGTLTILLVWWVGRKWFGREAGIAAATLLALSEYHISLSRTALTDVAFSFFFVLALGIITLVYENRRYATAVAAGLAVGAAWNTKYHGWFALVITSAALLPFLWRARKSLPELRRLAGLWIVMGLTAIACYLPWALFIESQPGGYAALTEYQRTFIDWSPGQYLENLWVQVRNQGFFEGPSSRIALPLACLTLLVLAFPRIVSPLRFAILLGLVSIGAIAVGLAGTTAVLSLAAIGMLLKHQRHSYAAWVAVVAVAFWGITSPLYHPYARLILPFSICTYVLAGYWISAMATNADFTRAGRPLGRLVLAAGAICLVLIAAVSRPDPTNPWNTAYQVDDTLREIEALIPPQSRVVVIGEPSLAFYLELSDRRAFADIDNWEGLAEMAEPVYIVAGSYSRAPDIQRILDRLGSRLTLIATVPMNPKDMRVIDDFRPWSAAAYRAQPDNTYDLRIMRLLPASTDRDAFPGD